ncbi:glutathione peroxidase [Aquimarina hainanensis]|uniref:Glutathione peroxidase n=1 Tax=Aquimarina hainanensis TaxID=1578017 RepID=A0ABW5NDE5_9FLAO
MKYFYKLLLCIVVTISCNQKKEAKNPSIYDIEIQSITGETMKLSDYKGKKILIVNVASKCGFTKQYKGLQALYEKHQDSLVIIGVPCNQFGQQEPGTKTEIQSFCKLNYGVTFPLTEKLNVQGEEQHHLYQWLTDKTYNKSKNSKVKWNFQKYLISEQGTLLDVFSSEIPPLSNQITKYL